MERMAKHIRERLKRLKIYERDARKNRFAHMDEKEDFGQDWCAGQVVIYKMYRADLGRLHRFLVKGTSLRYDIEEDNNMKGPYVPRPEFLELKKDWDMLRPYLYLLKEKKRKSNIQ